MGKSRSRTNAASRTAPLLMQSIWICYGMGREKEVRPDMDKPSRQRQHTPQEMQLIMYYLVV